MVAGCYPFTTTTDGRNPYDNSWSNGVGFTWGPGVIYSGATYASTNVIVVEAPASARKAALDYKRLVS